MRKRWCISGGTHRRCTSRYNLVYASDVLRNVTRREPCPQRTQRKIPPPSSIREGMIALHTMRRKQLFPSAFSSSWTERQARWTSKRGLQARWRERTAWRDFIHRHYMVPFVRHRHIRIYRVIQISRSFIRFDICVAVAFRYLRMHTHCFAERTTREIMENGWPRCINLFLEYKYPILSLGEINGDA